MVDASEGAADVRGGQFIARLSALLSLPGFDLEVVARMQGGARYDSRETA